MPVKKKKNNNFHGCILKMLPQSKWEDAEKTALEINPGNVAFKEEFLSQLEDQGINVEGLDPSFIAILKSNYWGSKGVKLGVRFLDTKNQQLIDRILSHFNAWGEYANVSFAHSNQGEVRVTLSDDGYWSYLGTDILHIAGDAATMSLEGFSMNTPDSEYKRVIRHEVGHTLGCPHEHSRAAIIEQLDVNATIRYFQRSQGWNQRTVIQQILTPLEDRSIFGSPTTDEDSIMCYWFPAECTKDRQPIVGGKDITSNDGRFMGQMYPKAVDPVRKEDIPIDLPEIKVDAGLLIKALESAGYKVIH